MNLVDAGVTVGGDSIYYVQLYAEFSTDIANKKISFKPQVFGGVMMILDHKNEMKGCYPASVNDIRSIADIGF